MKRVGKLFKLAKGNIIAYIGITILILFHQWSYSYVPLFTSYSIWQLEGVLRPEGLGEAPKLPEIIKNIVSNGSSVLNIIIYLAIALLIWQIVRYSLRVVEMILREKLKEDIAKNTRIKMYDHIQNLDYDFHNNSDTGDLVQRVTTDIDTTSRFLTISVFDVIYLFSTILFGALRVGEIDTTIMLVVMLIIPAIFLTSIIYFKAIRKRINKVELAESATLTVIQENLSASKVVRAFANEKHEIQKFDEKNQLYRKQSIGVNQLSSIYWGSMDAFAMLEFIIVVILAVNAGFKTPEMTALLLLVGMLIWPMRGFGRIVANFGEALIASERLNELLDKDTEYVTDGSLTPVIAGRIEFNDVSFAFKGEEEMFLKNLSFVAEPGETIALIGKTGCGKSTIVNLLLRMHEYTSGSIKIDGVELKEIKKHHVRENIGSVLQHPFLYSKTIRENIAITNRTFSNAKVTRAAEEAALAGDISKFQGGYETIVGERGATLSGGQKQRVAIARVLITHKPILIFDDALSAVDTQTDIMIRNALAKRENIATNIIVTHRITTAKEATKIIVLRQGVIEDIGTHEELSKKAGLYKTLWDIQGALESEFEQMVLNEVKNNA